MDQQVLQNRLYKSETERESIDLCAEDLGKGGAELVAAAVSKPGCPLKSLLLEDCNINDQGALALAEAIKVNENLQKLSLFGNADISADAVFQLVAALNVNTGITDYDGPGDDQLASAEERAANRQKYLATRPAPQESKPTESAPPTGCCVIA